MAKRKSHSKQRHSAKSMRRSRTSDLSNSTNVELMEVIRNRERAELLLLEEINRSKSELLLASSSLQYLVRLKYLGLLDMFERAKSRGVRILILYSELDKGGNGTESGLIQEFLADTRKYADIRETSGQIRGTIQITDNSRVLSISEEGLDALTIYSNNKSLLNNFGSLFEALWVENEMFQQLIKAKNELLKSNEQLRTHDKLQQEFINIAAHELRTPIQPILGMAEMLGAYPPNTEEEEEDEVHIKKKDLQLIGRNAARLERLSSDILDVSRIESGSFRINKVKFDINVLVIEAIDDIAMRTGVEKLKIAADLPDYQVMVVADRERIMQVLSNLLSNAIRFDPVGRILITLDQKQKEVSVKVKDSGIGISDDIRPRLFTKFASTLRDSSGTGLGLYLSKSIIEAHGGVIWGENNSDGTGAVFGFTIPLTTNFSTSPSEENTQSTDNILETFKDCLPELTKDT